MFYNKPHIIFFFRKPYLGLLNEFKFSVNQYKN